MIKVLMCLLTIPDLNCHFEEPDQLYILKVTGKWVSSGGRTPGQDDAFKFNPGVPFFMQRQIPEATLTFVPGFMVSQLVEKKLKLPFSFVAVTAGLRVNQMSSVMLPNCAYPRSLCISPSLQSVKNSGPCLGLFLNLFRTNHAPRT